MRPPPAASTGPGTCFPNTPAWRMPRRSPHAAALPPRGGSAAACGDRRGIRHAGVLGKQVPGPVEAAGGGLMTGDDECHDLVDELTLAHGGAALLVARAHEHREVVEVLLVPGAPLRDELRYDLGERAKPVRELQVARLLLRDHLEGVAAGLLGQAVQ